MANIVIHKGRNLTKDLRSPVLDVPSFTVSAVSIVADGEIAKAIEDDAVFHAQLLDAVNDHLDETRDIIVDWVKKTDAKISGLRDLPEGGERADELVESGNAMLKKVAASLDGGVTVALQKAFDTYNSRKKLNLKYKVKVTLKVGLAVFSIGAAAARGFFVGGLDPTAYLSVARQILKLAALYAESVKDMEDLGDELVDMMDKLQKDIEAEVKKSAKQVAKEAASAALGSLIPILSGKMATINNATQKAEQFGSRLVDVDKESKELLAKAEVAMKEIRKLSVTEEGGKSPEVKELGQQTTVLLDEVGEIQANLKGNWKFQEAAAAQLAEWQKKRNPVAKFTPIAVSLASKAYTALKAATRMVDVASAIG